MNTAKHIIWACLAESHISDMHTQCTCTQQRTHKSNVVPFGVRQGGNRPANKLSTCQLEEVEANWQDLSTHLWWLTTNPDMQHFYTTDTNSTRPQQKVINSRLRQDQTEKVIRRRGHNEPTDPLTNDLWTLPVNPRVNQPNPTSIPWQSISLFLTVSRDCLWLHSNPIDNHILGGFNHPWMMDDFVESVDFVLH